MANKSLAHWDSEEAFSNSDDFFGSLIKSIELAKSGIDLETYIFSNDALGSRLVKNLSDAAKRGIRVRVMVDGFGSPLWKFTLQNKLANNGVNCKIYKRIPFNIYYFFPLFIFHFTLFLFHLSKRNHRKLCVIDKNIAYLGSMNIAAYHLSEFYGLNAWRDSGAKVAGADVAVLSEAFESSWKSTLFSTLEIKNKSDIARVNNSRSGKKQRYLQLLERLKEAQENIWLTTAYFVPPTTLIKTLKNCSSRGIDIKILTTSKTIVFPIRWMRPIFYKKLLDANIEIYEYQPAVMHAKYCLIDQIAIIGSTNLNRRSFFHDLEADVLLSEPSSVLKLKQDFLRDISQSKKMHINEFFPISIFRRALANLAFQFRAWL